MLNPTAFEEFLHEDDVEQDDGQSTAYDLYKIEMDAKFEQLDTDELRELHAYYRGQTNPQQAKFALDRLVHALLPIVPHICGRFQSKYSKPNKDQWDDCIQAGNVGLLQGIQSWKPEGGTKLSSWVYQYAQRDIGRQLAFLEQGYVLSGNNQDDVDENQSSDNGEQAALMEREVDYVKLRDNLAKLSPTQQKIVNLLLSGKSLSEASRLMGVSRQAAFTAHERAIEELKRRMLTND